MIRSARQLGLAVLIAFALVAGQVGGWVHAFSHLADHMTRDGDAAQASGACEHCAFFANLASGAAAHRAPGPLAEAPLEPALPRGVAFAPRERFAFHSRAPPAFL